MKTKRTWTMNAVIVTGCVLVALATQGCPCPKTATGTNAATTGVTGPIPGPIIDTSSDPGGGLAYRYDETLVASGASGDIKTLDNRFIAKSVAAVLIDSLGATNGKKIVFGLAKTAVVKVTFSDGAWYTVTMGNSGTPLVWTCSSAGGSTNVVLTPGSAGQIPDCLATISGRKVTSIETTSGGKKGDILLIKSSH